MKSSIKLVGIAFPLLVRDFQRQSLLFTVFKRSTLYYWTKPSSPRVLTTFFSSRSFSISTVIPQRTPSPDKKQKDNDRSTLISDQAEKRSFSFNSAKISEILHSRFSASTLVLKCPNFMQPYLRLARVHHPVGSWLLFWPGAWSICLAATPGSLPDLKLLTLFGIGAFLMRSSACIINDLWDSKMDRLVERTKNRPLASGELNKYQAMGFLALTLSSSLLILLQLNHLTQFLGVFSLLPVIAYPSMKRITYWPQLFLGFTINWGAIMGWTAATGSISPIAPCVPLYIGCVFWTLIYDTIYAHQDKHDDILAGVKSLALRYNGAKAKPILYQFSSAMTISWLLAGVLSQQSWPFYAALVLTCGHVIFYQIATADFSRSHDCFRRFISNVKLGNALLIGIILSNLLR